MQKARRKECKIPTKNNLCEERLACKTDKEKPVVKCLDCGTLQCSSCEKDLHKEGDFFFHERVPVGKCNNKTSVVPSSFGEAKTGVSSREFAPTLSKLGKVKVANKGIAEVRASTSTNSGHPVASVDGSVSHDNLDSSSKKSLEPATPTAFLFDNSREQNISDTGDFSSSEFQSLGLDSILSGPPGSFSNLSTAEVLNQRGMKPPKKSKSRRSSRSSSSASESEKPLNDQSPLNSLEYLDADYFSPHDDSELKTLESNPVLSDPTQNGDEDLISELIQSQTDEQMRMALCDNAKSVCSQSPTAASRLPVLQNGTSALSDMAESVQTRKTLREQSKIQSFLLLDENEELKVIETSKLYQLLGCSQDASVKVVSIFGNTGDGKSYTLNHVFFKGQEVFTTSSDQVCCTVGVWAAYDPETKAICIDTEGLLGISNNQNQRTRLLLKVLAISDVVVYRTCADRLHTDLFQFLGDASVAYQKHFKMELENMATGKDGSIRYKLQDLGPSVIVFHETTRTNTLEHTAVASGQSATELLRSKFADLEHDMSAFSSIHYVGTQTKRPPTDFTGIRELILQELSNRSVRSPRSPKVVLSMLKVLNDKFCGDIYKSSPNSFPNEFFTCSSKCLACHNRCGLSMNHSADHSASEHCKYIHVYDNKVYICKKCYANSIKSIVVPKTCSSEDNSLLGVAKYAWAGYVLECRNCGIIYRSRQHWYGNRDPTQTEVQIEIRHIWPGQTAMMTGTHNAARKMLDGVKAIADTVNTYSSKPARLLGDWVADQVAPPYWVSNNDIIECYACHRIFGDQEKKHHCRSCGKGFCDECTQYSRAIPERGWGTNPVRVCESCYKSTGSTASSASSDGDSQSRVIARQVVENVQSVLGAVASVAIDYPIEVIKDSARPAYWVPDHQITACYVCDSEFGTKSPIHHCRACGNGVCANCSSHRRHVPSRGWDKNVRVCNTCYKKPHAL